MISHVGIRELVLHWSAKDNIGTMVLEYCWSQVESAAALIAICVSTYGPLLKGRSAGSTRIPRTSFKDVLPPNTQVSIRDPMQHPAHLKTKSALIGPNPSPTQSNVFNRHENSVFV